MLLLYGIKYFSPLCRSIELWGWLNNCPHSIMSKKEKSNPLMPKQKKFADEFIKTGDRAGSAMKVYDVGSRDNARKLAHETLNKPHVKEYVRIEQHRALELLQERGVDELVADYVFDGHRATRWIQKDGREEAPDWSARRDAAKFYQELKLAAIEPTASTQVLHLEKNNTTSYELTKDIPKSVIKFVLNNNGKLPDEKTLERLLAEDDEKNDTYSTT